MTLSDSEIIEKLESWKQFTGALKAEDRELLKDVLRLCHYFPAMRARESLFPSEGLFMSILLMQHKTIIWLIAEVEKLKGRRARCRT